MAKIKSNAPQSPVVLRSAPLWADICLNIGLIAILVAMVMPLAHVWIPAVKWVFGAGALLQLIGRAATLRTVRSYPVRLRRLCHIEVWATLFFVTANVFMWLRTVGPTDWIAFTLAGGALLVYTSIMKPRVAAKELRGKDDDISSK